MGEQTMTSLELNPLQSNKVHTYELLVKGTEREDIFT